MVDCCGAEVDPGDYPPVQRSFRTATNCETVQDAFSNIYGLELYGDRISPIKHLRMSTNFCTSCCNNNRQKTKKIMQQIVDAVSVT